MIQATDHAGLNLRHPSAKIKLEGCLRYDALPLPDCCYKTGFQGCFPGFVIARPDTLESLHGSRSDIARHGQGPGSEGTHWRQRGLPGRKARAYAESTAEAEAPKSA